MSSERLTATPAVRFLRERGIEFSSHPYRYQEHGGTAASSRELDVDEHAVVKTIVLEDDAGRPFIVLMHGDREVSLKAVARLRGVRAVSLAKPEDATRHTGYLVGGTSPFGTRKTLPVYLERSILELEKVYLNGGRRGLLVGLRPADIVAALSPQLIEAAAG